MPYPVGACSSAPWAEGLAQGFSQRSFMGSRMQTTRWMKPNMHVDAPPRGSSLHADIGGINVWIRN